jgi:hypothetical protein
MEEAEVDPADLLRAMLSGPGADYEKIVAPGAKLSTFMKPKGYVGPEGARQYWRDAERSGWEVRLSVDSIEVVGRRAMAYGELQANREGAGDVHQLAWGCDTEGGLITVFCVFTDREEAGAWLRGQGA